MHHRTPPHSLSVSLLPTAMKQSSQIQMCGCLRISNYGVLNILEVLLNHPSRLPKRRNNSGAHSCDPATPPRMTHSYGKLQGQIPTCSTMFSRHTSQIEPSMPIGSYRSQIDKP
jgi:hypothetical protein